jgi:DNA-binding transcriptional ArsR family regulator
MIRMVNETVNVTEEFQPAEEFVIDNLETLKVLADPLRLRILEFLAKPGTVKQIAQKIDRPPTKLYYHFNLLEKHGLIEMVDTRIVSGIIEKHYQASAQMYRVQWGLLSPGSPGFDESLQAMLAAGLGDAQNDVRESFRAGLVDTEEEAPHHRRLLMTQGRFKLTDEQAVDFSERLMALMKEFEGYSKQNEAGESAEDDDAGGDGAQSYKLLVMMHPTARAGYEDDLDDE